jgi:hypothetical protein
VRDHVARDDGVGLDLVEHQPRRARGRIERVLRHDLDTVGSGLDEDQRRRAVQRRRDGVGVHRGGVRNGDFRAGEAAAGDRRFELAELPLRCELGDGERNGRGRGLETLEPGRADRDARGHGGVDHHARREDTPELLGEHDETGHAERVVRLQPDRVPAELSKLAPEPARVAAALEIRARHVRRHTAREELGGE